MSSSNLFTGCGFSGGLNRFFLTKNFSIVFLIMTAMLVFSSGCNPAKSHLNSFNSKVESGCLNGMNLEAAALYAESKIPAEDKEKPSGEDLLWTLQGGYVERMRQDHEKSSKYFERSEEMLNYYDNQNVVVDTVAATLVNDNVVPYTGHEYDGIMLNTYKAMTYMLLGQEDAARVEFNRAIDRQRRVTEKYEKEIAEIKQEFEETEKEAGALTKQALESTELQEKIAEQFPGLHEYEPYPDFVNPFTTYIAGVYFNLVGDHEKAADLIKKTYGMVGDNDYIGEDLIETEAALQGTGKIENTLWVFFENGLGPIKTEQRIDLPLFIATDKVKYFGIALPKLEFRDEAYEFISVKAGEEVYQSKTVAHMDRVVQTEFEKDFQAIVFRAVMSATVKAIAQYALEEQGSSGSSMASWIMAGYTLATTTADVRMWTMLPKNFQVARLGIPESREIEIYVEEGRPYEFKIPDCSNALLYVRIPYKGSEPVFDLVTY